MIHPTADVATRKIGSGTRVWQYSVICEGVEIGEDCNVCAHCFVESGVVIGDRVTIKNGVSLWTGVTIEDDVFVGPGATFANDRRPRSKLRPPVFESTTIRSGASIGANAVILPGLTIGSGAMIGAGAVVTSDVPAYAIVKGNPGRVTGFYGSTRHSHFSEDDVFPGVSRNRSSMVRGVKWVSIQQHSQARGDLHVVNCPDDLPFQVRRFFIVSNVPRETIRGNHAHRRCHQFLVCTAGACLVTVDDGENRATFELASPSVGLHISPLVWGIQHDYSDGASLLVLASEAYDRDEYVNSYEEFRILVRALER